MAHKISKDTNILQLTLSTDQQRRDLSHGVQIRGHLFMDSLATYTNTSRPVSWHAVPYKRPPSVKLGGREWDVLIVGGLNLLRFSRGEELMILPGVLQHNISKVSHLTSLDLLLALIRLFQANDIGIPQPTHCGSLPVKACKSQKVKTKELCPSCPVPTSFR